MATKKATFPTLSELLGKGIVRVEGAQYVGTASDGAIVAVGTVGDEKAAERYLSANPNPSQW